MLGLSRTTFSLLLLLSPTTACTPALVRAASAPANAEFGVELTRRQARGDVSSSETRDVARAFLEQQIRSAAGAAGRDTLAALGGCAAELEDALEARARSKHDDVAAEALFLLADEAGGPRASFANFEHDPSARFQHLYALSLVGLETAVNRRMALRAELPELREGALLASLLARDSDDAPDLLDMARREPVARLRTLALRSLTELPADPQRAEQLADLYTSADPAQRVDIALAWALPPVFELGGRARLLALLAQGDAEPQVLAAAVAWVAHGAADAELAQSAVARLLSALRTGTEDIRVRAAKAIPMSPAALTELRACATVGPYRVQIAANERLAVLPADSARARAHLWQLAGQRDEAGAAARVALAGLREARVQAWLETDLIHQSAAGKLAALEGLLALGRGARALPLLRDPSVRLRAACRLLAAR